MRLFAYGTLMFPEIWHRVVGRDYPSAPGALRGYAIRRVIDDLYPVVFACDENADDDLME